MTVIRLGGNEKEIYLKNLITATEFLIKSIRNDNTLKKNEWDIIVYDEIIKILEYINKLFFLLKRTIDEEDYKNDFGIYREIVLSNGGLPEFFSYRQLLEDKIIANERIKQILESEDINSKEDLIKKWIDSANNDGLGDKEDKRNYLLGQIPEKFQTIEFYEKIKDIEIFDIRDPMKKLDIKHIKSTDKKEKERYIISFFNYTTGFGVWNTYIIQLREGKEREGKEGRQGGNRSEQIKKGYKRYNIFKKDNIPSNGHFVPQEKSVYVDSEFKKFLEDHMSSGAFFLAREIDKKFPTIYPERVSRFQFGPNFVKGINSPSLDFSWLLLENPYSFFLTAAREDIQSGKNEYKKEYDTIDKIIRTKCSWKRDKIIEQRFGICPKELEKSLKEYIKFSDMRLYII